LHRV
jgi:hypothetical protein